jgi:hypothetical protein
VIEALKESAARFGSGAEAEGAARSAT